MNLNTPRSGKTKRPRTDKHGEPEEVRKRTRRQTSEIEETTAAAAARQHEGSGVMEAPNLHSRQRGVANEGNSHFPRTPNLLNTAGISIGRVGEDILLKQALLRRQTLQQQEAKTSLDRSDAESEISRMRLLGHVDRALGSRSSLDQLPQQRHAALMGATGRLALSAQPMTTATNQLLLGEEMQKQRQLSGLLLPTRARQGPSPSAASPATPLFNRTSPLTNIQTVQEAHGRGLAASLTRNQAFANPLGTRGALDNASDPTALSGLIQRAGRLMPDATLPARRSLVEELLSAGGTKMLLGGTRGNPALHPEITMAGGFPLPVNSLLGAGAGANNQHGRVPPVGAGLLHSLLTSPERGISYGSVLGEQSCGQKKEEPLGDLLEHQQSLWENFAKPREKKKRRRRRRKKNKDESKSTPKTETAAQAPLKDPGSDGYDDTASNEEDPAASDEDKKQQDSPKDRDSKGVESEQQGSGGAPATEQEYAPDDSTTERKEAADVLINFLSEAKGGSHETNTSPISTNSDL